MLGKELVQYWVLVLELEMMLSVCWLYCVCCRIKINCRNGFVDAGKQKVSKGNITGIETAGIGVNDGAVIGGVYDAIDNDETSLY